MDFHYKKFFQLSYPGSPVPVVASRSPAARLTGLVAALRDPPLPCPVPEAEDIVPPGKFGLK